MDAIVIVYFNSSEGIKPTREILVAIKPGKRVFSYEQVGEILDNYAKQYDFDRDKLTGQIVDTIPCPEAEVK